VVLGAVGLCSCGALVRWCRAVVVLWCLRSWARANWVVKDLRPGSTDPSDNPFKSMIQKVPTMVLGIDVGHGSPGHALRLCCEWA